MNKKYKESFFFISKQKISHIAAEPANSMNIDINIFKPRQVNKDYICYQTYHIGFNADIAIPNQT